MTHTISWACVICNHEAETTYSDAAVQARGDVPLLRALIELVEAKHAKTCDRPRIAVEWIRTNLYGQVRGVPLLVEVEE